MAEAPPLMSDMLKKQQSATAKLPEAEVHMGEPTILSSAEGGETLEEAAETWDEQSREAFWDYVMKLNRSMEGGIDPAELEALRAAASKKQREGMQMSKNAADIRDEMAAKITGGK